jgi:hypothetical protein
MEHMFFTRFSTLESLVTGSSTPHYGFVNLPTQNDILSNQ